MKISKFDIYEKINPSKFNIDNDNWEDNEDEEDDDIYDEYLDKIIGGTIYRATFKILFVNEQGEIISYTLSRYKDESYYWNWGGRHKNYYLYDIEIDIKKLKITKIAKNKIIMIPTIGKKINYSISYKSFINNNKIFNFYIRQNDILSFNKNDLKDGLRILYRNNIKYLKNSSGIKTYRGLDFYKRSKHNIKDKIDILNKSLTEIDFLLKNKNFLGYYINIIKLKNDRNKFNKDIILLNKKLKNIDDIISNLLKNNMSDIDSKINNDIDNIK